MKEITNLRKRFSKTLDIGGGKRRVELSGRPRHYRDPSDGSWKDIDTTPQETGGGQFKPVAVQQLLNIGPGPAYRYHTKGGRPLIVALLGGRDVVPVIEDKSVVFHDIFPDTDYVMIPLEEGCATFLRLKSAAAPREWQWLTTGATDLLQPIVGRDASGRDTELQKELRGSKLSVVWSGRVAHRNDLRDGTGYADDAVYPVLIDPTVNEAIVASADDRLESMAMGGLYTDSTFLSAGVYNNAVNHVGWRFQVVDVPQGATINSAEFSIYQLEKVGTPVVTMYGCDEDDSVVWSASVKPTTVPKTTASTVLNSGWAGGAGLRTLDVTDIVQEIVDRPGWAANNDMSLVMMGPASGSGHNRYGMADYSHATQQEGRLSIDYTAGGGGGGFAFSQGVVFG